MDRFAAAARDGFAGVEYMFPYEFAAADVAAQLREHRLTQVLFSFFVSTTTHAEKIPQAVGSKNAQLASLDNRGWVECEYTPQTTTSAGLNWMRSLAQMSEESR